MTITVEDGSLVSDANSYVTLAAARAYVTERAGVLPSSDDQTEAIMLKAMDYLDSFDSAFKGDRVSRDQALSWPRTDVYIEGWYWAANEIPRQVINAQLSLILEISLGDDPFNPTIAEQNVTRETVGPITVEYSKPNYISKVIKTAPSSTHINLLLKTSGLSIVRV